MERRNKLLSFTVFLVIILIVILISEGNKNESNRILLNELYKTRQELLNKNKLLKDSLDLSNKERQLYKDSLININKDVKVINNNLTKLRQELKNIKGKYSHLTSDSILSIVNKRYEKDTRIIIDNN